MEGAEYKVRKNTAWKRVLCAACAVLTAGVMTLQTGFVSLAYPSSGMINDTGVNIRSTSDSSSSDNVMKKSETGMEVSVLGEETGSDGNTWLKVSYNDNGTERIGYIRQIMWILPGIPMAVTGRRCLQMVPTEQMAHRRRRLLLSPTAIRIPTV